MNRKLGVLALASVMLSIWLVSASACSGGGDDSAAPGGEVTEADAGEQGSTDEPASPPGDVTDPSPFEPPVSAPTDGEGPETDEPSTSTSGDGAESGTGDAMAPEPSPTDNGPEQQRPTGDGGDTASIAGVWDYSRTSDAGTDTVVIEIDATGGLIEYDYQNDDVGSGRDCNVVRQASIASRGDDRYDIQDSSTLPGSTSIDDVLITVDGGAIVFRYLGDDPDPQFGGGQIGVTERFPAASGEDVISAEVCDDEG